MKFENTEVFNFKGALRGMRNPKNSWDRSDSKFDDGECICQKTTDANLVPNSMALGNLVSPSSAQMI